MKHDTMFLEQLHQEVPRRNLSPKATQRFEDTYRMLGVQQEAPVRRRRHKALWVTATAACLCCGMMFGVNAAFPAFAESLPGVGKFFQTVNGAFFSNGFTKSAHGEFLDTYDTQTIHVSNTDQEYSISIHKVFCDGTNGSFALDITAPQDSWETFESLIVGPDLTVSVNGIWSKSVYNTVLYRGENGLYTGAISFALPQSAENGDILNLEVSISEITYPDKSVYEGYLSTQVDLTAAFPITVDTSSNRSFLSEAKDNGCRIRSVRSTPTSTMLEVSFSDEFTTSLNPVLLTTDGISVSFSSEESRQFGGFDIPGGAQDCTLYFDGVPAGTQQVVLRFYEDYTEESVLTEFTIDLANETVVPSTTYEDGGALDLNSPFHYKYLSGHVSGNPDFKNHFAVSLVSYSKENSSWEVDVVTDEAYKEILVEAYTAQGELIGSTVSDYGTVNGQSNWFWDESSPWWGKDYVYYPYYGYRVYLECERSYMAAIGENVTVVIKDSSSGEELVHQEVSLDQSSY